MSNGKLESMILYNRQIDFLLDMYEFHGNELIALVSTEEQEDLAKYLFLGQYGLEPDDLPAYRSAVLLDDPGIAARVHNALVRVANHFNVPEYARDFLAERRHSS